MPFHSTMRVSLPVLIALVVWVAPQTVAAQIQSGDLLTGQVTSVISADTYEVRLTDNQLRTVRLWAVAAPAPSQPYGSEAIEAARDYTSNTRLRIRVTNADRYGRIIGRVEVRGIDLGALLLRDGYAWHYDEYAPAISHLARLQKQARTEERGLWNQSNPTPPWKWGGHASTPAAVQ